MQDLTNEELSVQARNGDKAALEQLWTANKPFIITIVKKYTGEPLFPPDFDADGNITGVSPDLMNESFLVMAYCVADYDPACGYTFLTHLKNRIEWRFLRLVQEQSLVKVPSYMMALRKKYSNLIENYYKKNGKCPTDAEACEKLGIDQRQLDQVKGVDLPLIWLDAPCGDSGDSDSLYELLEDEAAAVCDIVTEKLYNSEVWKSIKKVVTVRQYDILQQRYMNGSTYADIGEQYNISPERIRTIIDDALSKIRRSGICVKELTGLTEGAKRSYYLGGVAHYRNNIFTSSTEKQALKNTERHFKRKRRKTSERSEDIRELEKELISFFGDVV